VDAFIQQVVNGLSIGSVYVLIGLGLTIVFGLTRLVNFAHGQLVVLGSFLTFALVSGGLSFWVALPIASVGVGAVGAVLDAGVLRRTLDYPVNGFIASLGLLLALQAVMVKLWSGDLYEVPSPVAGVVALGDVRVPAMKIVVFAVVAACVLGLFVLLKRTDLGRSMRAVAESHEGAALVGIPVGRMISVAFFLGTALAGLGGALLATLFPFTPFGGLEYVLKGLAVALIGGLGSIEGAVVAGLSLGLIETLGTAYGIGPEWGDGYAYLAMVLLLLWRPHGLFGQVRHL
jgi:branched-chain amino acid transport system permease protein